MVSRVSIFCTILCSNLWFVWNHTKNSVFKNMHTILWFILWPVPDTHVWHTLVRTVYDIHATTHHHVWLSIYFLFFVWWPPWNNKERQLDKQIQYSSGQLRVLLRLRSVWISKLYICIHQTVLLKSIIIWVLLMAALKSQSTWVRYKKVFDEITEKANLGMAFVEISLINFSMIL